MSNVSDVRLKKTTVDSLKEYVNDFGMTVDDVVLNLIEENNSLRSLLGQGFLCLLTIRTLIPLMSTLFISSQRKNLGNEGWA